MNNFKPWKNYERTYPSKTTGLNKVTHRETSTHYEVLINGQPYSHIPLNYHGSGKSELTASLHDRIKQAEQMDRLGKKIGDRDD